MIKYLKYILIIFPIILVILLGINIYKYNTYKNNNHAIIKNTNSYEEKIKDYTYKLESLNKELTSLKEEKKDKIWEYERWIKWNKEMLEKIN